MALHSEFIHVLCCPKKLCRGDLEVALNNGKEMLRCLQCDAQYPIIDNIPVLFPNAQYASQLHKRHWDQDKHAKSYAGKYNQYLKKQGSPWGLYTHVSELHAIKKLTKDIDLTGKTILDCGCGNARVLAQYPEAAHKIGSDASLALLQEAKKRDPDLWLVCSQAEDLPFKDCIADYSFSVRVYQHLRCPEQAFAEMVRVTRPAGFVALQVYNKYNLKELYKRFRMIKVVDRFKPWGLDYDRYYSYREIREWCRDTFVTPVVWVGAGWGFYFYLFDRFKFRRFAPRRLQEFVYNLSLRAERIVGRWPFFSKTMEKVCFIGSVQSSAAKANVFGRIRDKYCFERSKKQVGKFQQVLEDRNYAQIGSDRHHYNLTVNWLKIAQDATPDAGVSRGFSLVWNRKFGKAGWQPSYPETTGYIIPTMIKAAKLCRDTDFLQRARLMANWEIAIMLHGKSVQGGNICTEPKPAVFDTGQVIRGLFALYEELKQQEYLEKALQAARWILANEDRQQGRWVEYNASCVNQYTTTYNVYAIAPLARLGVVINDSELQELAYRTGKFTMQMQNENGWFCNCDFQDRDDALLHTIAYAIDGLWDLGEVLEEKAFLDSAKCALDATISQMAPGGWLPGRFNASWAGTVDWACLTGVAQIGVICMKAFRLDGDVRYYDAARNVKNFLKACQNNIDDTFGGIGAVWGSWPVSGGYAAYQAINWAAKYFADLLALFLEQYPDCQDNAVSGIKEGKGF